MLLILILLPLVAALGFHGPTTYKRGEKVELIVNKVESDNTQLPYGYYDLPFVCPLGDKKPLPLSLGEILRGDRLWESTYELNFGVDDPCHRLCDLVAKDHVLKRADHFIRNGYFVHWLLDGLPGATTFESDNRNNKYYAAGFPLGFVLEDKSYIYNHVMLVIRYHRARNAPGKYHIVGFEVYPKSVSNEECPKTNTGYQNFAITFGARENKDTSETQKTVIPYTYSVYWREDNTIDYTHRWDLYLENDTSVNNHRIHWLSVINSVVLIFLVTIVMSVILLKILGSESLSATLPVANDKPQHYSNRSLHRPVMPLLLSVLVAGGVQIITTVVGVIVILFVDISFDGHDLSLAFQNRQGAVHSFSLLCIVGSGPLASYVGIIVNKILHHNSTDVKYNTTMNNILSMVFCGFVPALVLAVVLFINFFVWAKASSNALPLGTIVILLLLFVLIELPLGIIGGYYGNKKKLPTFSGPDLDDGPRSNLWVLHPIVSTAASGLIPFGIIYVELTYIFNSVWLEKTTYYYMYGFLLLAALMLIVIIAELAVIATYFSISAHKNPAYHWLCFRVGSSVGWYILAYSVVYFFTHLYVRDFVSILLYFAYMILVSAIVCIGCGAIGIIAGRIYANKAFNALKVE